MKISTKGRYGLRAMVDLAVNSSSDYTALNEIAERQDVSENYLEQVFATLRKAGLVKSIKGAQGGYALADAPSKITVGNVLRVLEGDLSIVENIEEKRKSENLIEQCITDKVWETVNGSINKVVDSITLENLAEEYKQLNNKVSLMFYI
ncbi:MAG: Rrf2 family transcriptional regulator [Bacillota bacterium]|nr:Rrf2 family transcriptional regulator [Bacillota bacterium]